LVRARKFLGGEVELSPAAVWLNNARNWFIRLPAVPSSAQDRVLIQGYLSYLAGDPSSAARWFGVAAEDRTHSAEARWRRAISLAALGQLDAARKEAAAARECRPNFEEGASDWLFLFDGKDDAAAAAP
jgi:Flp pilus assembly protein TadD